LSAVVTILSFTCAFSANATQLLSPDELVELTNQIEKKVEVKDQVDMSRLQGTVVKANNVPHADNVPYAVTMKTFIYSADHHSIDYQSVMIDGRKLIIGTIIYNGPQVDTFDPKSGIKTKGKPPKVLIFNEDGEMIADATIRIARNSSGTTSEMEWGVQTVNDMRTSENFLFRDEKKAVEKLSEEFDKQGDAILTSTLITDLKKTSPRILDYLGRVKGPLGTAVKAAAAAAGISASILGQTKAAEADVRQETMFGKKKKLSEALQQHDEENSEAKAAAIK
jgi:hypothetical protein